MPTPPTIEKLRGMIFSAVELKALTNWDDAVIEDYLNLLDNFILIANALDIEIDQKIEEISTDFKDGSIPYAENGKLIEDNDNLKFDNTSKSLKVGGDIKGINRAKQYFFAGF